MESSPLGAFEIEKLFSAQGRHELWAQKGQASRIIICLGTPYVWVVKNRREYLEECHLTILVSGFMPCIGRDPLSLCTFFITLDHTQASHSLEALRGLGVSLAFSC